MVFFCFFLCSPSSSASASGINLGSVENSKPKLRGFEILIIPTFPDERSPRIGRTCAGRRATNTSNAPSISVSTVDMGGRVTVDWEEYGSYNQLVDMDDTVVGDKLCGIQGLKIILPVDVAFLTCHSSPNSPGFQDGNFTSQFDHIILY